MNQHSGSPLPALTTAGLAALLRLAVLCVDSDGRIAYWNRGAEELFGHRWENVFGRRASGLLATVTVPTPVPPRQGPANEPHTRSPGWGGQPYRDALDRIDDVTRTAWAGAMPVTDRDGTARDVLWWSYRLIEPVGRSLLILAVNAKPLRTTGPRIALGEQLVSYVCAEPEGSVELRITPGLAAVYDPALADQLCGRLGTVLPRISAARLDRIMRQLVPLGYPVLQVEKAAPLAIVPLEVPGGPAQARTAQSGTAQRSMELPPAANGAGTHQEKHRHGDAEPATCGNGQGVADDLVNGAGRQGAGGSSIAGITTADLDDRGHPNQTMVGDARTIPGGVPMMRGPAGSLNAPGRVGVHPSIGSACLGTTAVTGAGRATDAVCELSRLLHEAETRIGTSLDLDDTARELCAVAVPRFADFAAVHLVDRLITDMDPPKDERPDKTALLRRIATSHRNIPHHLTDLVPEGELFRLTRGPLGAPGQRLLVSVVDPALADDVAADLGIPACAPLIAGRSLLIVALIARGTVLGRLVFLRNPRRIPFDDRDAATAEELAVRGALGIDNARLHLMESRVATTLQRSMLPTRPPKLPGVRIAHHYRPGDRQAQVGGDWFDAVQLPGGRVALVVGDVMGHGLHSAAVMGQFRTAVQTMAALDLPPAQLLRHLDNLAHRLGQDHLATCIYVVYDPIQRTCTLANAGHVPPVLARPDGTSALLQVPEGAPIGVGGVPFETVEFSVPDGSWLVLCTDGLVEVRDGGGIGEGLAALCENVIEPQQTPEEVCDVILGRLHTDDRSDDVALLVAKFEGIPQRDVAKWQLPLDFSQVRKARALTHEQLAEWGLESLCDLTELLVSELVTNAVRAATRTVELCLMRVGKLLVEVSDDDHNLPLLRRAEAEDEDGRGLALVSNLSRRWGTSRKAVGKVVWFELPLPHDGGAVD